VRKHQRPDRMSRLVGVQKIRLPIRDITDILYFLNTKATWIATRPVASLLILGSEGSIMTEEKKQWPKTDVNAVERWAKNYDPCVPWEYVTECSTRNCHGAVYESVVRGGRNKGRWYHACTNGCPSEFRWVYGRKRPVQDLKVETD